MTPVRRQFLRIKQRYPDALLLFRMGDFYETFDDDARIASRELEIVLTSRSMGKGTVVPLAGIPAHSLEPYLARLIKQGHKVAICEQLSDPAKSKGLVERDVVRVVTPGTVLEPSLLEQKANNYLAAVALDGDEAGVSYVDITTGEFCTTQLPLAQLALELGRLAPAEVLAEDAHEEGWSGEYTVTPLPVRSFQLENARRALLDHFAVVSLEPFGCESLPLATRAAGAIVDYLSQTQRDSLGELTGLNTYSTSSYMTMDRQTRRNLELFEGGRWGTGGPSLYSTLDLTRTPMGGRLLRRWLGQPLRDIQELVHRQDAVEYFHANIAVREQVTGTLARISDLERVSNRIRLGVAAPRELVGLKGGLEAALELMEQVGEPEALAWLYVGLDRAGGPCQEVIALVESSLSPDPTGEPGEGNVIKEGFSPELDELRLASHDARGYIAGLETKEREETGIRNLKVGYNRVFGYYIEVTRTNLDQVPERYVRRQTLVGGERYITPELKEYESLILNARERIEEMERSLYRQVCAQIGERSTAITVMGETVAHVDAFSCLAEGASRYGYVRPRLTEDDALEIGEGRHPVVERVMPLASFIPNDTYLSTADSQLVILTGPNMAGKSTYIRQVALIVLMAQIGSFVPARSATLGLVDRIFTRVGLQDDLATGQSTFMIEMVETAAILNQATPRSLVILDEIGRGTSTYDGLSIARSVVEYLHNNPRLGCKTLFATHYHELTQLADTLPRVRNHTVAVSEEGGQVIFLHRIVPGGADKSYGIHVAQLAGLPRAVVNRAWEVLGDLEGDQSRPPKSVSGRTSKEKTLQMSLFTEPSPAIEELLGLDVANMTPLEAINALYRLQQGARDGAPRPGEGDSD